MTKSTIKEAVKTTLSNEERLAKLNSRFKVLREADAANYKATGNTSALLFNEVKDCIVLKALTVNDTVNHNDVEWVVLPETFKMIASILTTLRINQVEKGQQLLSNLNFQVSHDVVIITYAINFLHNGYIRALNDQYSKNIPLVTADRELPVDLQDQMELAFLI